MGFLICGFFKLWFVSLIFPHHIFGVFPCFQHLCLSLSSSFFLSVELSSLSLCMTNSKLGEPCFYVIGRTENTRLVMVPVSSSIFLSLHSFTQSPLLILQSPNLVKIPIIILKICNGGSQTAARVPLVVPSPRHDGH